MKKLLIALLILPLFMQDISAQVAKDFFNCFTIIAGKDATASGDIMIAHNEDDFGDFVVNYYNVPARTNAKGSTITLKNGAEIPEATQTYRYLWMDMPGLDFSDSYVNEFGVVVFSNSCPSREDQGELTDGGIGYWLRRIIAERARTAYEGVQIAGELIEAYGYYSSGRSYTIAGPNEAWLLSAVNGKHWVAQRIPDDKLMVLSNYYVITEIDLSDSANFAGSPDIITYAIERGWYNPQKDGAFNFAKAYSAPDNLVHPNNITRKWGGLHLLAKENFAWDDTFPFAVTPKNKITPEMLMDVLAYHYEGTEFDKTKDYELGDPHHFGEYTICTSKTQYGIVAELRKNMPADIGVRLWIAPFRPCVNAFVPWYLGISEIPKYYTNENNWQKALNDHFTSTESYRAKFPNSAQWTYVDFADQIDKNYKKNIESIRAKKQKRQQQLFNRAKEVEQEALQIYDQNPQLSKEMLNEFLKDELKTEAKQKL